MNFKNTTILFFLFIALISKVSYSQKLSPEEQTEFDSLTHIINQPAFGDSAKADAYISILRFYYRSNPDTAIYLSQQAEKLAKHAEYEVCLSDSYGWLGYLYAQVKGDYKKGVYYFKKCLKSKTALEDSAGISSTLNNIGYTFNQVGQLDSALYYYDKSLKIDYQLKNLKSAATSLGNIGRVYLQKGDILKAIESGHKSLSIRENLDDNEGYISSLMNMGTLYNRFGDVHKAEEFYNQALQLAEKDQDIRSIASLNYKLAFLFNENNEREKAFKLYQKSLIKYKEIGDENGIAITQIELAKYYKNNNSFKKAIELLESSISISSHNNDQPTLADAQFVLSSLWFEQKKYSKAEALAIENLQLSKSINFIHNIRNASYLLYKINKQKGHYNESLKYYETYINLRDSLNSEKNQKAVIRQEYQYEYEKQAALDSVAFAKEQKLAAATIAQQEAEADKKDAELQAKRNQQYALFGGLGLLLIFGGFMYNRFKITKRQKSIIEIQKEEVDLQKTEAEKQRDFAQKEHEEAEKQKSIVEEKNKEILDSIQYAKRLQDAILPPQKLVKEYFTESFILFKPKDIVSGDFYWMEANDDYVFFAAADCTGHGVPGAMVSVVCANALNKTVNELGKTDPADILNNTRSLVIHTFEKSGDDVKDGMDISLCTLEKKSNKLFWAGANNPLWIIRKESDEIESIKPDKQPVGKFGELTPFTSHQVDLKKEDIIYMFSDGYADQFGGKKGKKMKSVKFKQTLLENKHQKMDDQAIALDEAFEEWKGDLEQIDDVCVIGIKL